MNETYEQFLEKKLQYGASKGFEPTFLPDYLFPFQQHLVDWSVRLGRGAIFADCGLGKTVMELTWAQNVVEKTARAVLILTPLAVSYQTLEEAEKFGIEAQRARPGQRTRPTIYVTNYEQLHKFDNSDYAGVVCDESSILKNPKGFTKDAIVEFMRTVPYRLLGTATAAPNDWVELGTSSEALGYLGHQDMISSFFTNKSGGVAVRSFQNTREKFYLRAWAAEGPFWKWVTSWARAARRPSDLGFDDNGFILPELREHHTVVTPTRLRDGMLFELPASTFHEEREVRRRTIRDRCEAAAEKVAAHDVSMIWCNLNDESGLLADLIPNSVEVKGSDSLEHKEEAARWFVHGDDEQRRLISKASILGFGMNFQHAHHMTYFPTHSYERYYQATRRLWRFGQENPVTVDLIYSDGGKLIMENLQRKSEAADEMFDELVHYMHQGQQVSTDYHHIQEREIPQWMSGN